MNTANPTPLRVGATGTLDGHACRVAGRTLVGMEEAGATYYWTEFNVVDDTGFHADLVFEETEAGAKWSLFIPLVPANPMSVADARARKVGDTVTIDGTTARVTLVDQSRVYFVEGQAAEGVEVGDVANYFNAEADGRTLVASWTGDEIEYYRGRQLSTNVVASAFGFPAGSSLGQSGSGFSPFSSADDGATARKFVMWVFWALIIFGGVAGRACRDFGGGAGSSTQPPAARQVLPTEQLSIGARGSLRGVAWQIAGHAAVEVSSPGNRFGRHEYQLAGPDGRQALLFNPLHGKTSDWQLLYPIPLPDGPTAYDYAAMRRGGKLELDSTSMAITALFNTRPISAEGTLSQPPEASQTKYGLIARLGPKWGLVRWTEWKLEAFTGETVPAAEVLAAFSSK